MANRPDHKGFGDHPERVEDLLRGDAYLNDLAAGRQPMDGDAFASSVLGLKTDIEAGMPAAPEVGHLAGAPDRDAAPATTVLPAQEAQNQPISLDERRARRGKIRKHRVGEASHRHSWMSALIGTAASVALVVGGATAVYNAEPGTPLWGLNKSIFEQHTAVIELAGTIEKAKERQSAGDAAGARALMEQARAMADGIDGSERDEARRMVDEGEKSIADAEKSAEAKRQAEHRGDPHDRESAPAQNHAPGAVDPSTGSGTSDESTGRTGTGSPTSPTRTRTPGSESSPGSGTGSQWVTPGAPDASYVPGPDQTTYPARPSTTETAPTTTKSANELSTWSGVQDGSEQAREFVTGLEGMLPRQ